MNKLDDLQVRQLDETLSHFQTLRRTRVPTHGWVRAIRQTLGMSLRQLADRTGMSKTAVASAEQSEGRGTIRLDTLRRLADGLDCELVYVLVPRTSLRNAIDDQARTAATNAVGRVSKSMELELQGIDEEKRTRQIADLTEELLRSRGRDFWDG